eukprot:3941091-Rhodomonas_salina.1
MLEEELGALDVEVTSPLCCYASATCCPAMLLRLCYVLSGTEIGYAATPPLLDVRYAMCGPEIGYAATLSGCEVRACAEQGRDCARADVTRLRPERDLVRPERDLVTDERIARAREGHAR